MAHNSSADATSQSPSDSDQLGGATDSEGTLSANTPESVGQPVQGVSAVSDILSLTADQRKAYAGFDPALHAVGADGKPIAKKGGGWQLKRGRKASDPNAPTAPRTSSISAPGAPAGNEVRISNEQAATMACAMVVGAAQQLLGDDWAVTDKSEKQGLVEATRAYLDATGGMDLSPGAGLVFAWGPYAMQRIHTQETRSRLKRFGDWLAGAFNRRPKSAA